MQHRPSLRTVAATDATCVVAATGSPLVQAPRTAAVVAICAPSAVAATVAFLVTDDAGAEALRTADTWGQTPPGGVRPHSGVR